MAIKKYEAEDIIVSASQSNEEFFVIAEGAVFASAPGIKLTLGKGDIIGVLEIGFDAHYISYMATENTKVIPYSANELKALLEQKNDFSAYFFKSICKQINSVVVQYNSNYDKSSALYDFAQHTYKKYIAVCSKLGSAEEDLSEIERLGSFIDDSEIYPEMLEYYEQIYSVIKDGRTVSADFLYYFGIKTAKDSRILSLGAKKAFIYLTNVAKFFVNDEKIDLYGLFCEMYFSAVDNAAVKQEITDVITEITEKLKDEPFVNQNLFINRVTAFEKKIQRIADKQNIAEDEAKIYEELNDSAQKIAAYAEIDENEIKDLLDLLGQYKKLKDYADTTDATRHLRLDLTNFFYRIYEKVFFKSITDNEIPKYIRMFLEFGYMDEEITSKEDLLFLYHRAGTKYADNNKGIYTFYDWLKAIYEGKKLPSKNEFDVDYEAFIHEKKVKNQITAAEEGKLMADRKAMVSYELKNMFLSANKVTFGRISIFCPIYNSANMIGHISQKALDTAIITECIDAVRKNDFSIFYRDSLYKNDAIGLTGEYIDVEILPDVILMPNAGTRALLWQEIQGRVRNTPARMILPTIDMEDVKVHILRMCGEYRWEMCKRIQGGRWNDVTDPSLTSEYFDYIQFYRKNHELSPEVKEKVKLSLQRAKNSFKEMFVYDYMIFVSYECEGAPRLNKVSRAIIGKYCPFTAATRKNLAANPTYKDMIIYYQNHQAQKIHRMENLVQKLNNASIKVPSEIINQLEYLKR